MNARELYRERIRKEDGFGLVEVLIAMTLLAVGILALFAMFEAGIRQISRASTVTTAGALADKEMESYVAMRYDSIGLPESLVTSPPPSPYSSDPAYESSASDRVDLSACGSAPCTNKVPVQTLTGADGRSYRVDTYVTWDAVSGGRNTKRVTIVVRSSDASKVWARVASTFDESTGE